MNKLKVIYRAAADLVPYVNNAREHSDEQVTQIAASIKEFGFNNPILIDEDSGIIAGHGRLMAAKKLGLEQVPTITLSGLTDAQRKAYIIADNKIALNSDWNDDLLALEFDEIGDLVNLTGFDADELNLILNGWESDIVIPDEEPEIDDRFLLRLKVDGEAEAFAKECIENALQQRGIEYEFT